MAGSDEEPGQWDDTAVNPAPPPEAELAMLRSDAIGDTMYSERGVLRILIALNEAVPRYLGVSTGGDALVEASNGETAEGDEDRRCDGDHIDKSRDGEVTHEVSQVESEKQLSDGMHVTETKTCDKSESASTDPGGATTSGMRSSMSGAGEVSAGDDSASHQITGGERGEARGRTAATSEPLVELEPELEQQLCQLWDMTAERDVAAYLHTAGLLEIVWPLLGRSPCPRLLEIIAGILANCVSHPAAGGRLAAFPLSASLLADAAELLMANSRDDAPLLAETLRLVTAGVCGGAGPPAAPLMAAAAGWLPLLQRLLAAALSPHLLHNALALVSALAATADDRAAWLARLAELDGWAAAMLEAVRQLVTSPSHVSPTDLLSTCRDTLRLIAELAPAPADRLPGALECVRAVSRGCPPDARVAGYLLWLLVRGLQSQFSGAALADALRYCRAALDGRHCLPPPARHTTDWSARAAATPMPATSREHTPREAVAERRNGEVGISGTDGEGTHSGGAGTPGVGAGTPGVGAGTPRVGAGTPRVGAGTSGVGADTPGMGEGTAGAAAGVSEWPGGDDETEIEARQELESRLGATVAHLAARCDALPHFLASVEPGVATFYRAVLGRHAPQLASMVVTPPLAGAAANNGTVGL